MVSTARGAARRGSGVESGVGWSRWQRGALSHIGVGPPLQQETVVEFRDRREKEKWELHNQMFEEHCMVEED